MLPKLLKLKEVAAIRNVGMTRLDVEINDGLMPAKVMIGRNAYLPEDEVDAVMRMRIDNRSDEQIRSVVRHLLHLRQERAAAVTAEVA